MMDRMKAGEGQHWLIDRQVGGRGRKEGGRGMQERGSERGRMEVGMMARRKAGEVGGTQGGGRTEEGGKKERGRREAGGGWTEGA
jgi:hypothetical protein